MVAKDELTTLGWKSFYNSRVSHYYSGHPLIIQELAACGVMADTEELRINEGAIRCNACMLSLGVRSIRSDTIE